MEKTKAKLESLKKTLGRLKEALALPFSQINQDAVIKRFEFTFELSWKLMQALARENGIEAYGVKNIIREGARLGLIGSPEKWFEFLEARNLTSHTYQEETARIVYEKTKEFIPAAEELIRKFKHHLSTGSK